MGHADVLLQKRFIRRAGLVPVQKTNGIHNTIQQEITMTNQVTLDVPLALQNLIKANNTLLKTYQSQLMDEIQHANTQMMAILKLDPNHGWRLDMENMVYIQVEPTTTETASTE